MYLKWGRFIYLEMVLAIGSAKGRAFLCSEEEWASGWSAVSVSSGTRDVLGRRVPALTLGQSWVGTLVWSPHLWEKRPFRALALSSSLGLLWRKLYGCRIFSPPSFFLFLVFRATPTAYGNSQARGLIGATAAGLHHSHSNVGSKPHLQPTPQLPVMLDH